MRKLISIGEWSSVSNVVTLSLPCTTKSVTCNMSINMLTCQRESLRPVFIHCFHTPCIRAQNVLITCSALLNTENGDFRFSRRWKSMSWSWVVTPCSEVVGYQRFGGPWYLHLEDGGGMALRNVGLHIDGGGSMAFGSVGILPHHYTSSQPRRPRLEKENEGKSLAAVFWAVWDWWATFLILSCDHHFIASSSRDGRADGPPTLRVLAGHR
jgi:hypothetical protein